MLRSLVSGLTSNEEDGINCDDVESVGEQIHMNMDSKVFSEITLKRTDQIKSLSRLEKGIKIGNDSVQIDPMLLFSRLLIQVERSQDVKQYFGYELTPMPTSLFNCHGMRKSNKSSLAALLTKDVEVNTDKLEESHKVIDGGGGTSSPNTLEARSTI